MKRQADYFIIYPYELILHELHPAYGLPPEVRTRLTNGYGNIEQSARKFSKRSLVNLAERRIIVAGSKRSPSVISGWSILHLLQMYQVEERITCAAEWKLPKSKVRELCYLDFFLEQQIERNDEIAQRIRAILMQEYLVDYELTELVSVDSKEPKAFFNLAVHKQNRLQKALQNEAEPVQNLIAEAYKPLGIKDSKTIKEKPPTEKAPHSKIQANTVDDKMPTGWKKWFSGQRP